MDRSKTSEVEKRSRSLRALRPSIETTNAFARPRHPELALQRIRSVAASELTPADILEAQHALGNRAVGRILQQRIQGRTATEANTRPVIQAKSLAGAAGDEYEPEGDRVATPVVTADATSAGNTVIQRQPIGFEFESDIMNNATPTPNQGQNQANAPQIAAPNHQGEIEFVTGPHAANAEELAQEIPDIPKLIALIKKLMLIKTQPKKS